MADRLSTNAARTALRSADTERTGARRSRRASQLDRDLAELAALLTGEQKRMHSPSIADGEAESVAPRDDAPAIRDEIRRELPRRRPVLRAERAWNDNPAPMPHPRDLDDGAVPGDRSWDREPPLDAPPEPAPRPAPRFRRLVDDMPLGPPPPPVKQRSVVTRALTIMATLMSVVALLGVSALLVLLAIGERPSAQVTEEPAQIRAPAASDRASEAAPPAGEPSVITGSASSSPVRDESRIAPEEFAIRGGGTVRAAETEAASPPQQLAERWPAQASTPANDANASAPELGALPRESAAPVEVASTTPPAPAAAPAAREQEPAAAANRTARVNAHVNLRAKPENDAAVVVIVPEGREVEIASCDRWCQVGYDGKQGYIHQRFLKE